MSVTLGWDLRSGLILGSLFFDTCDPDGSGFHLFSKVSVSLSRDEVETEEEEDEEAAMRTEDAEVVEDVKDETEEWGVNTAGVEDMTTVEEEKVEVKVAGVPLSPVSCALNRPLTERSMGEQLE